MLFFTLSVYVLIGFLYTDGDERYTGSSGSQVVAKSRIHFGPNCARLQRLKKQYDPELLFNKWFVVVPA
jgi:FAD/FMN-containing dehydrogenase